MKSLVFTLLAFLVTWQTAQAEVSMPKFFSDNMVLQRERPIRIWGRSVNGESVTVRFAGSEVSVQADRTGRWEATLPAMAADATPREMTVTGSCRHRALHERRGWRRVALQRAVEHGVAARSHDGLRGRDRRVGQSEHPVAVRRRQNRLRGAGRHRFRALGGMARPKPRACSRPWDTGSASSSIPKRVFRWA